MKRREFLKLCGCFVLSTSISYKAFATLKNLNGENLPNFKLDIRPLTINVGVTKRFLLCERKRAYAETVTQDCRHGCSGCGANKLGGKNRWCN